MKLLPITITLCTLAADTSAALIPPLPFFRAISLTLPGATNRKRSEQEASLQPVESALEKRADLFSACGTLNLASKYQNYPINGYGYASAQFAFGGYQGSSANIGLITTYSTAKTAYDCCVTAMQQANSTLFFFTSNPSAFSFGGGGNGQNCQVVYNSQCPIPQTEAITMAVSYNASAPRGTSYGNYVGNGNCGPGVRLAINNAVLGNCVGSSAGIGVNNGPGGGSSAGSAGSAAAACTYTGPNVPDQGGTNPVGSGSSAGSSSSSG